MLVPTSKYVAAACEWYFRYLGHRFGSALRGAHHYRPTRPYQFRRYLMSRLHSRLRYLLDHSKQPCSLSCQKPQTLSPTRTGKSDKHLSQAKRIRYEWNAHKIPSTDDFPSCIRASCNFLC